METGALSGEALSPLWSVEVILPSQGETHDLAQRLRHFMATLLEGALHDILLPPSQISENALRWIVEGHVGHFTFHEACEYLGLDEEAVRKRALAKQISSPGRYLRGNRTGKLWKSRAKALDD